MNQELISELQNSVEKSFSANKKNRFVLGICGAPGVGKSTLADWIVSTWNSIRPNSAVLLPMDGYHRSNKELEQMGLLPLKGIPASFNSEAFLAKLKNVHSAPAEVHLCPKFDRSIEASIDDAIAIKPHHELVVVEGNYLLLNQPPWNEVCQFLDESWFLDCNEDLILPRLISRHESAGKTEQQARAKVESTDLPNARLVHESRTNASKLISAKLLSN